MRFMSIIIAKPEHNGQPTPELKEAVGKMSEREIKAGRMIDTGGLTPIEQGIRVNVRNGKVDVLDGPFTETKEVIGGYAIFELKDMDEARTLAVEFMQLHAEHMPGWEGTCEVREFMPPGCC